MSWVAIEGLRAGYRGADVLDGVSLSVPRGALVAVLGPSGCGKTTLLRAIAGLVPASAGSIEVGGRVLSSTSTRLAPEKRGIGWVPQDASLFPHLSVGENIGFGLARKRGRSARIAELAELVGLAELVDRAPGALSGGQAQRVSLARALAHRPDLVLLDEPFAALDPQLRGALRGDVAGLLREQGATSLLVTHDQEEALSLADYVAVMRDGRILQWGTPREVYEEAVSPWVAAFVGDIVELDGRWSAGSTLSALGTAPARVIGDKPVSEGQRVRLILRPEWLRLGREGSPGVVETIAYAGHDALVEVRLDDGVRVRARVAAPELPAVGERLGVRLTQPALAAAAS